MSAQLREALLRSLYQALGTFAATFFVMLQLGFDAEAAAIAGIVASLETLGFRGVVEGGYDARRAARGDVRRSDVGYVEVD